MIDLVKNAFKKETMLANVRFFILLNLGLVLTALGIVWFKTPTTLPSGAPRACRCCCRPCSPSSTWAFSCGC